MPNEPAIYVVSRKAREVLGLGTSPEDLHSRRVQYARLRHTIAINDCRVRIIRATRQPGLSLLRWLDEDALRPFTLAHGLLPDAWFQVERQSEGEPKKSAYFLEAEISEKGERALRQKLTSVGAYLYGGHYAATFGTKALRVLCLLYTSRSSSSSPSGAAPTW